VRRARLLAVPVAIAAIVLFAAPAFATRAPRPTVVLTVQVDCTQSGKFCFDFSATTTNIPADGGNIVVTVFGIQQNRQAQALGGGQNVHFGQNVVDHAFAFCFPMPAGVTFTRFQVQVKLVEPDLSVTLNGSSDLHVIPPARVAASQFWPRSTTPAQRPRAAAPRRRRARTSRPAHHWRRPVVSTSVSWRSGRSCCWWDWAYSGSFARERP
jgi:hypothetical protein